MPKQGKTLGQSDANALMEVLEFLVVLFIVNTFPDESANKQLSNVSQDKINYIYNSSAQPVDVRSCFKVGGMWLGKNFLLK